MEFTGNVADSATAVELLSFGQMRLHSDLRMNFTKNIGRFVFIFIAVHDEVYW